MVGFSANMGIPIPNSKYVPKPIAYKYRERKLKSILERS